MSSSAIIAKNTTFFTGALMLQKVFSFVYFALIARLIGDANLGKYVFAMSFTTIFSIFIDIGLAQVLTRETAKAKEKVQEYFSNIFSLKLPLAFFVYLFAVVAINLLGYPAETKFLVYLAGAVMFLDSFSLTFYAVLRGHQKLQYESLAMALYQAVALAIGYTAVKLGYGIHFLIIALICASFLNCLFAAIFVKIKLKLKFALLASRQTLKYLVKIAFPFAMLGVFSHFYSYFDTILLSKLAGDKYVGWYSIAFKITFALQMIPKAFAAAIYPAMSEFYGQKNEDGLARIFEHSVRYLAIIAVPVSLGIFILADKIILTIWPEFFNSILPLQIMVNSLLFLFLSFPVGAILNACNKQAINTINMAIVMLASIVMNIVLIPLYQAVGASITSLITSFLLFFLGLAWVSGIAKYDKRHLVKNLLKTLISGLGMGIFVYYFKERWGLAPVILLGGFIYMVLIFGTRAMAREDVNFFVKMFSGNKKNGERENNC